MFITVFTIALYWSQPEPEESRHSTPSYIHFNIIHHVLPTNLINTMTKAPGSILGTTRKKVVSLERGPLSLVSTTEELLDRKVAAPV
jgi:hypothetical protein